MNYMKILRDLFFIKKLTKNNILLFFLGFSLLMFGYFYDANAQTGMYGFYQCSDFTDNDSDGLTDDLDPGCHLDGDADNGASYDTNLDSEIDVELAEPILTESSYIASTCQTTDGIERCEYTGVIFYMIMLAFFMWVFEYIFSIFNYIARMLL